VTTDHTPFGGDVAGPAVARYTAFSATPEGGNPAGVVLDATGMTDQQMLDIAAAVGYSETAFLVPRVGHIEARYFSPLAEVSFCGHATIAAAVAHAEVHGAGRLSLATQAGRVDVHTSLTEDGSWVATLTSVEPRSKFLAHDDLAALLTAFGWSRDDLDVALPPAVAYAGAWHPVLAVRTRSILSSMSYDMAALRPLMDARGWTTIQVVWREAEEVFHVRNPFPPGGVVEDPATGAAAAALGGYLRERRLVRTPVDITIRQGDDMGRPSVLQVGIPADPSAGLAVTGTAARL
jgi:PhzF family phenazine biosynthesis protein